MHGRASAFCEEKGYFATLGVDFRSSTDDIAKAYKIKAFKLHPDRNPSPEAAEEFHRIATSFQVLSDDVKRRNYYRLFVLRCYMSQENPRPDGPLRPHYAFSVEKSKFAMGGKSDRLLTFDLIERTMHSFKKDTEKKAFPLTALASVKEGAPNSLELTIHFKETHPYYLRCRSTEQYAALLIIVSRIVSSGGADPSDQSLNLLVDDTSSPPSSFHKSKVIKRSEKIGSALLLHDWQPRFMVMGATQLVLFRDTELTNLVNILPLTLLKFVPDRSDPTCFQLTTHFWKASFRVVSEEVARRWASSLHERQAAARLAALSGEESPSGRSWAGGAAAAAVTGSRPSVAYFEEDLTNLLTMLPVMMEPVDDDDEQQVGAVAAAVAVDVTDAPPTKRTIVMPPPIPPLNEKTSSVDMTKVVPPPIPPLPEDTPQQGGSTGRLRSGEEEVAKPESEEERQAQMKALREEEEEGMAAAPGAAAAASPANSDAALAEAKAALLTTMHQMERALGKARKGIEADRPLKDIMPMIDGLKRRMAAFDGLGADYERRMAARDEHQKTFLQTHASYLDGLLRKHGLGDEPNNGQSSSSNAAAGKIFRKAAYVAETFRSAPLRTVL